MCVIKDDLALKGLSLYDVKLEFGKIDGKVVLIDEISCDNLRVYENKTYIESEELFKKIFY